MKQTTPYSKTVLVLQKLPREDLKHKHKLSQAHEKALPQPKKVGSSDHNPKVTEVRSNFQRLYVAFASLPL